jgi:hypothetical protein
MCNINNRPPTPQEQQKIKYGYKVFNSPTTLPFTKEKCYYTPFQSEIAHKPNEISEPAKKYTFFDEVEHTNKTEKGYHIFRKQKHAKQYKQILTEETYRKGLVVKKVQIHNILAIGQIAPNYYGNLQRKELTEEMDNLQIREPDSIVLAEQITIMEKQ